MKKLNLILDTVRIVNSFIMIIALFSGDASTFYVSCYFLWLLLIIRFIFYVIKKIKRKKHRNYEPVYITQINTATKTQCENFSMLEERVHGLFELIESNVSYYEAQREYINIKQSIEGMNNEELKETQKAVLMLVLEALSDDMLKLELKK